MIKLLNATLTNIEVETELTSEGCPTCNFGEEYTTYVYLEYDHFPNHYIPLEDQNKISLTTIIKLLSEPEKFQKMTPQEFYDYLYENLSNASK